MSELFKPVGMKPEDFIREAEKLVEEASSREVVLRILGAAAVYIHSRHDPEAIEVYRRVGRFVEGSLFTDLDLAAYSKQRKEVMEFFEKIKGFKFDPLMRGLYGYKRLIYFHPEGLYHVDVFFDKLEFNHDVVWGDRPGKGRLELDYPTIDLADIVLEKLQITKINPKDLVDLAVLFKAHEVCEKREKECIDGGYIASILSDDWGFWYDATNNLAKLKDFVQKQVAEGRIPQNTASTIIARVDKLLHIVESTPKTKNWIKRSKIGTSKPWYREVEEVIR